MLAKSNLCTMFTEHRKNKGLLQLSLQFKGCWQLSMLLAGMQGLNYAPKSMHQPTIGLLDKSVGALLRHE
jgi:hypothetical protein